MKNTKCPNKRLCWGYMNGGCDTCSAGAEVNRIYKRIDRLKKQNETLTIQRNAWALTAKAISNKWIKADEKLPQDGETVLVWFEYFRYGDYNCPFQMYGLSHTFRGEWSGIVNDTTGWKDLKIIAWQPLPEPPQYNEVKI